MRRPILIGVGIGALIGLGVAAGALWAMSELVGTEDRRVS